MYTQAGTSAVQSQAEQRLSIIKRECPQELSGLGYNGPQKHAGNRLRGDQDLKNADQKQGDAYFKARAIGFAPAPFERETASNGSDDSLLGGVVSIVFVMPL